MEILDVEQRRVRRVHPEAVHDRMGDDRLDAANGIGSLPGEVQGVLAAREILHVGGDRDRVHSLAQQCLAGSGEDLGVVDRADEGSRAIATGAAADRAVGDHAVLDLDAVCSTHRVDDVERDIEPRVARPFEITPTRFAYGR
jgi:hypothetical protein